MYCYVVVLVTTKVFISACVCILLFIIANEIVQVFFICELCYNLVVLFFVVVIMHEVGKCCFNFLLL
jgi:hypothetical protein